jgi:hypothetical protein
MKSYGVNWWLVWVGLLVFMWPFAGWWDEVMPLHSPHPAGLRGHAFAIACSLASGWTCLYWYGCQKTLGTPEALEKLRAARRRRRERKWYSPLIFWALVLAVVLGGSLISRAWVGRPAWSQVLLYTLLVPTAMQFGLWLQNRAYEKGDLARRLAEWDGGAET